MKTKEAKELSLLELENKLRETRDELLHLRLRKETGQVDRPHLLREMRRDIARLETFLQMKKAATGEN